MAQPINIKANRMKSLDFGDHQGQLLTGNVYFEQTGSRVYCDRAEYDPREETLYGTGNVRITNPEGATVTGSQLYFDNRTHIAKVQGNVILKDGDLTLKTPWLQYHTQTKNGWYGSGGFIQDKETYLQSKTGRYEPNIKKLFFKGNVVLETDDYLIQTDTLSYETNTKKAIFTDYTQINTADEQIVLNEGYYLTEKKQGYFTSGFTYISKNQRILCADTAFLDKENDAGTARGHVWLFDSSENWMLYGDRGAYRKSLSYAEMFGHALAVNIENDSMWIAGDSLVSEKGLGANNQITRAIGNVKLKQGQTRSTANKLTHFQQDSSVRMRGKPVIWDSISRMSGDSIDIFLVNNKLRYGSLFPNALIVNQESDTFFSQIQGDSIFYALDTNQRINQSWVYRNGESIYYIKEDSVIQSAFKVTCKDMRFQFADNRIDKVFFYSEPKGALYPINQLPEDQKKLKRFIWDVQNKPKAYDFYPAFTPNIQKARYKKLNSIKPPKTRKSILWFLKHD